MTVEPNENEDEDENLIRRAAGGDAGALAELWRRHHGRLRRMVALRLDRRLQGASTPPTSFRRRIST